MKTAAHATPATGNSPFPRHAMISAAANAIHAEIGFAVAERIAGKVITESVTYGT